MSDTVEKKLYDATAGGRVSEVSSLLRDHPEITVNWTNSDYSQWTPLHIASLEGHVEVVKLLLAHPKINVNVKDWNGRTSLLFGCWEGQVSVVGVLLKDPPVDVMLHDNEGCTPLWWASRYGKHQVIERLIASGRDLGDIKNKKGKHYNSKDYTALEIARRENKAEAVSVLERFLANPAQTRLEIRQKLNFTGLYSVYFIFIFILDDSFVNK